MEETESFRSLGGERVPKPGSYSGKGSDCQRLDLWVERRPA